MAQSAKPIIDIFLALLFYVAIFAVMGLYIFGPLKVRIGCAACMQHGGDHLRPDASVSLSPSLQDNRNFDSLDESFLSLFVCLTTANYPDVMMPAYRRSRWTPLFFILFLGIGLYFLQNLLLAVAIEHFGMAEKTKFQRLFVHTRKALRLAFLAVADSGTARRV